jgi:3-hydroxybutyryl-CoA dehydrogenase
MAINTVGIVGAGIMGAGVAEVAASSGFDVVLRSRSREAADATMDRVAKSLDRLVAKDKLQAAEAAAIVARITPTTDFADLAECDLVIESVVENLGIKLAVFKELDQITKPRAILATNTSTLPVIEMAMATNRPGQVCGVHFFNPAPAMSIVELVAPLTASAETMESVTEFTRACAKTPIAVKDQAGFVVNALLFPYLNNAIRLLEGGVATREGIDTAMKGGCNFPMGPLALLDLVGLDTSLAILDALYEEYADANYRAVPLLRRMVAAGQLGRKSGQGFYDYT